MPATFQTSRRVEFRDTDAAGIMHFAAILAVMEEAEHEFLRHIGLPLFRPVDGGELSWPRVACSADFNSPVRFEDVIDVQVAIEKLGKSSVTYQFTLRCNARLVATGKMSSVHCLVSNGAIKSVEIPSDVVSKLGDYLMASSTDATD